MESLTSYNSEDEDSDNNVPQPKEDDTNYEIVGMEMSDEESSSPRSRHSIRSSRSTTPSSTSSDSSHSDSSDSDKYDRRKSRRRSYSSDGSRSYSSSPSSSRRDKDILSRHRSRRKYGDSYRDRGNSHKDRNDAHRDKEKKDFHYRDKDDFYRERDHLSKDRDDSKSSYKDSSSSSSSRSRRSRSRSPRYRYSSNRNSRRHNDRDRDRSPHRKQMDRVAANKLSILEKLGIELKVPDRDKEGNQNFRNPLGLDASRFEEQIAKRKMLWNRGQPQEKLKNNNPPSEIQKNQWKDARFSQDQDGKVTAKFQRLMGIKPSGEGSSGTPAPVKKETSIQKQEELFSTMEMQYEVARAATHKQRGVGLGFSSHHFSR